MKRCFQKYLSSILVVAGLMCVLALDIWWHWYRYEDCKAVGHSTLYCVGKLAFGD